MKSSLPGVYIHVPFCNSKCSYCDFYSVADTGELEERYLAAVLREIRLKGALWGKEVDSVFVGGGTPSCLNPDTIATVLGECGRYFPFAPHAEVTVEANPESLHAELLTTLRGAGVNRLSIGLQAAQDELLGRIGRRHDLAAFLSAYRLARQHGFANISVDVMYGLPGQSVEDYAETLKLLVSLGVNHVSCYALQLEEGTELCRLVSSGAVVLPCEDNVVNMFEAGRDVLQQAGFLHYEISNFAAPGFMCRHNLKYWRNESYFGFGPSAASFVLRRRFVNASDILVYEQMLAAGQLPVSQCEMLSEGEFRDETAMLALRLLLEGIDRADFYSRFGVDPCEAYTGVVAHWAGSGMLAVGPQRIVLTPRAVMVASSIQASFLGIS